MAPRDPSGLPLYQEWLTYWGKVLAEVRVERGLTQTELAAQANALLPYRRKLMRRQTIEDFEAGCPQGTNLTLDRIFALCQVLRVDLNVLLVDPRWELGGLVVALAPLHPETQRKLTDLYKPDGVLFRDRSQPRVRCHAIEP